jgi:hypothetical protein
MPSTNRSLRPLPSDFKSIVIRFFAPFRLKPSHILATRHGLQKNIADQGVFLLVEAVWAAWEMCGWVFGEDRRVTSVRRQDLGADELMAGQPADHPLELQDAQGGHDL